MISKLCARAGLTCLLIALPLSAYAAKKNTADEIEQLLSLDFEALTTVFVASKKEEFVNDAPGVITVVTADEIQRYGARNLRDILNRQTHIQILGSNLFPHNRTGLRGVTLTHVETDVLL